MKGWVWVGFCLLVTLCATALAQDVKTLAANIQKLQEALKVVPKDSPAYQPLLDEYIRQTTQLTGLLNPGQAGAVGAVAPSGSPPSGSTRSASNRPQPAAGVPTRAFVSAPAASQAASPARTQLATSRSTSGNLSQGAVSSVPEAQDPPAPSSLVRVGRSDGLSSSGTEEGVADADFSRHQAADLAPSPSSAPAPQNAVPSTAPPATAATLHLTIGPSPDDSKTPVLQWVETDVSIALCAHVTVSVNAISGFQISSGTITITDAPDDSSADQQSGAKTSGSKAPLTTITLTNGKATIMLPQLPAAEHQLKATLAANGSQPGAFTQDPVTIAVQATLVPTATCVRQMAPLMLNAVGVDVEGASSTSPQAVFLGNTSLDIPVLHTSNPSINPMKDLDNAWLFLSGSLRIAGMAQPGALSASAFTSPGYYSSAVNATPDKIVQSWEGAAAISFVVAKTHLGIGTFDGGTAPSGYPRSTLVTTSILFTGGFDSPLSASQAAPPVYYATNQIQQAYPNTIQGPWGSTCPVKSGSNPMCYVAFVPADRTRFYRYYGAGIRLRIYGEDFTHNRLRYPGIVDFTVGQNEYVTGGGLNGVVGQLTGVMPIPIPKVDGIYAFGSISSAFNQPVGGGPQLLLSPVPSTANVNYLSSSVYDVSVPQPNRDRYRLGFGVDLLQLLLSSKDSSSSGSGSSGK